MVNLIWQPGMTLETVEKEVILQAMRYFRGNKTATSTALGIAYKTLDNKLHQYKEDEQSQEKRLNERTARDQEYLNRARGIVTATVPTRLLEDSKAAEVPKSQGLHSEERHGLEPAPELPAQQSVSMQKREEVQKVSPQSSARSGSGQRGKAL